MMNSTMSVKRKLHIVLATMVLTALLAALAQTPGQPPGFKSRTVANLFIGSLFASCARAQASDPATRIDTEYLTTLHAPLYAPQAVNKNLLIFHPRDGGTLSGRITGKLLSPAGDWVRVMPDGSMRIDVRLTAELDDGSLVYVTYGGVLRKPDAESWARFIRGEKITAPQWYYVITPTFETSSIKYAWLNGTQAIGKLVSIQSGPEAHVRFDIYAVR